MSSKSMTIIGPEISAPTTEVEVHVDGPTKALLVKLVNPSGGGPTANVNLNEYGGVAVGAGNALHVQPGTGAVFVVADGGGSLTIDGTVAVSNFPANQSVTQGTSPWVVGDGGGSLTIDGTVAVSSVGGTVVVGDGGGSLTVDGTVNVGNFPATQAVTQSTSPWVVGDGGGSLTVDGAVTATATGAVSSGNSTTTPLGSSATFTGVFESVRDYAGITISLFADVASAANGFKVQWSHDGTNIDREDTFSIGAGAGRAFGIPVEGQFFRIVYVNGGSAQTTFRLGVVYKPTAPGLNAVGITEDVDDSGALVIATRSVITGETTGGGGGFVNVKVTPSGALTIEATQGTSPWTVGGTVAVGPTVVPGTGATNLGKAEDAAHTTGDVGVMALAVRNDSGAVLAGVTGDYIPLTTDSTGRLRTLDMVADAQGTANLLGIYTDTQAVQAGFGIAPMFALNDSPGTLNEGEWTHGFMSTAGGIRVSLIESTGIPISTLIPGTGPLNLGKAEDAVHANTDVGVMALAVRQDVMASLVGATNDYIPLTTDYLGRLRVFTDGGKITYRAATTAPFAAAAGALMFFVLAGSSTKTIVVQRIRISGMTLTLVELLSVVAEKWSTAPTGGTSTALTKVPVDSGDAAATANLCQVYTAAPTEGTLVGTLSAERFLGETGTATAGIDPAVLDLDFRNVGEAKGIYLRGTAQCFSLAFAAAPASAVTMALEIEWTEEP